MQIQLVINAEVPTGTSTAELATRVQNTLKLGSVADVFAVDVNPIESPAPAESETAKTE